MTQTVKRLQYARAGLRLFGHDTEHWKTGHTDAMACYEFEDHLQSGIEIFDSITRFDEDRRLRVLKGQIPYDASTEQQIQGLYKDWLQPSALAATILEHYESLFGDVKHADEFRSRYSEAKGIVTPDNEFFSDDTLVELRDAAIDEHRRGDTQDVGRSG